MDISEILKRKQPRTRSIRVLLDDSLRADIPLACDFLGVGDPGSPLPSMDAETRLAFESAFRNYIRKGPRGPVADQIDEE